MIASSLWTSRCRWNVASLSNPCRRAAAVVARHQRWAQTKTNNSPTNTLTCVRLLSSPPPGVTQSTAGTGRVVARGSGGVASASSSSSSSAEETLYARTKNRGPVSWPSLFLVGVAAASAVAYYRIERERRLEEAMGRVVSSESDGWTPRPDFLAKRKFVQTKYGWFPVSDVRLDGYPLAERSSILCCVRVA